MDGDFLKAHGFKIGDKIVLSSGTKDAVTNTLKTETFEILGTVVVPCILLTPEAAVQWEMVKSVDFWEYFQKISDWKHIKGYVSVKDAKALTALLLSIMGK